MKLWLAEYLEKIGVDENEFLNAYGELANADSVHIKKYLNTKKTINDTEDLLAIVKVKPHAQTFQKIAQALNKDLIRPDVDNEEVQCIQVYHQEWRERMLAQLQPRAGYQNQIKERIVRLKKSGFSLDLLDGMHGEDDPVTAYANKLCELLLSPEANIADLIREIEQLLKQAEQSHLGHITELTSLMANHFVPNELGTLANRKGVKIGSDKPAPAIYRHIQNWRNDVVSEICAYDKIRTGVPGAIPFCRDGLDDRDVISGIAFRLQKESEDDQWLMTGSDSYPVERIEFSERELENLNAELVTQSKTADSRFIYGISPDSIDEGLAEQLDNLLPALHHYSHVIERSDELPEVKHLRSFLNTAGRLIEKRSRSLMPIDPEAELHALLAKILTDKGLSKELQAAPSPVDRVKYLKWFNEVLKAEKGVREALEEYPEIISRSAEFYSRVTEYSATSIDAIKSFFSQFYKGY